MKESPERRTHRRLPLHCEALISVLLSGKDATNFSLRSIAMDISPSGLRARTYQLGRDDSHKLKNELQYARIILDLPYLKEPLQVSGKLVWVEYHDRSPREKPYCMMGFTFTRLEEDVSRKLDYVLIRMESESFSSDL